MLFIKYCTYSQMKIDSNFVSCYFIKTSINMESAPVSVKKIILQYTINNYYE